MEKRAKNPATDPEAMSENSSVQLHRPADVRLNLFFRSPGAHHSFFKARLRGRYDSEPADGLSALRDRIFSTELAGITRDVIGHTIESAPALPLGEKREKDTSVPVMESAVTVEAEQTVEAEPMIKSEPAVDGEEIESLLREGNPTFPDMPPPESSGGEPLPDSLISSVAHLYRSESVVSDDYSEILDRLLNRTGADALCILFPDQKDFVYRIYLQKGLDDFTLKNLYFSLNDSHLDDSRRSRLLHFSEHREDFFFAKRFSTAFLQKYEGALMVGLRPFGVTGYILLFYRRIRDYREEMVLRRIPALIRDYLPLFLCFRESQQFESPGLNPGFQILRHLKMIAIRRSEGFQVLHTRIKRSTAGSERRLLQNVFRKIRSRLEEDEEIFILPPDRFVFLLLGGRAGSILELLERQGVADGYQVESRILDYPDIGRNLYNYVQASTLLD